MKSTMERDRPVCMVGVFPPPVHGMAHVNRLMLERLEAAGIPCRAFNLAPPTAVIDSSMGYRLKKAFLVCRRLASFALHCLIQRPGALYMGISGKHGKLFELPFVLIARLFGLNTVLHHHTFSYAYERAVTANLLFAVAGPHARHVMLCKKMKKRLSELYRIDPARCSTLSNAAFLAPEGDVREARADKPAPLVLGFLGNVGFEKGIGAFFDVIDALADAGHGVAGRICGPCVDKNVQKFVADYLELNSLVSALGARYGKDKSAFFREIDVLVFPSDLKEAEPLTILEALSWGVPVVAKDQGCIPEIVRNGAGLVLPPDTDFVANATEQLLTWLTQPEALKDASECARRGFLQLQGTHAAALEALLHELVEE